LGLSENHIIVGELLEQKASFAVDNVNTHTANGDASWNPDSESSQATGGFSVAFSLSVVQVAFNTIWLTSYFVLICSYTCFFFLFWSDFYTSSVAVPSLTFCNIMHLIHIA
jgi:hypothetical protein